MTTSVTDTAVFPASEVPAGRSVSGVAEDHASMRAWAEEPVARARSEGVELTGDNGLLTALVRRVLQTGLEVELTDHVGYERHAVEGRGSGSVLPHERELVDRLGIEPHFGRRKGLPQVAPRRRAGDDQ